MSEIGQSIKQAAAVVSQGGLLVYPTEGIYGIGCDFRNQLAVNHLLELKQRPINKGLILIGAHIEHVLPLIKPLNRSHLARALKTWPGHATWVFPATELTPGWITGDHDTVAVRVTNHPVVKSLCGYLNQALVSTSANISGEDTPTSCLDIQSQWQAAVDYYLDLPLGQQTTASTIRLASTGQVLR